MLSQVNQLRIVFHILLTMNDYLISLKLVRTHYGGGTVVNGTFDDLSESWFFVV
jgi:hypothetical protein